MNKQELDSAIEAARKNAELAQQELARLEAIKPEEDRPLMIISAKRKDKGIMYYHVNRYLEPTMVIENAEGVDQAHYKCGNYLERSEQATAYARAFRTLLLIRRQPGVVGYKANPVVWNLDVTGEGICPQSLFRPTYPSYYMFPCFESEDTARAAIEAVGADNLIFTARFLAGAE